MLTNSMRQKAGPLARTQYAGAVSLGPPASAASASRLKAKPYQAAGNARTRTGVCLNSGSPESGSTTGLTTASIRQRLDTASFQCIGTKTEPGR